MKTKLMVFMAASCMAGASSVRAQGLIDFRNRITGSVDAPVYRESVGGTLLSGANFVANLWYGTSAGSLAPITDAAAPFRTGTGAGFWNAGTDSTRVLSGIPSATVFLQVRVWDSAAGATYDAAKLAGGFWGDSNVFGVTVGSSSPPLGPSLLIGLQSFALVPEPSAIALGVLGATALLFRRRK